MADGVTMSIVMRDIRDKGPDWDSGWAKWSSLAYFGWPLVLIVPEHHEFGRLSDTLLMGWSVLLATTSYMYHRERGNLGSDSNPSNTNMAEKGVWRMADNIFVDLVAVTLFCAMWGLHENWAYSIPIMAVMGHVFIAGTLGGAEPARGLRLITVLDVSFLLAAFASGIYLINENELKKAEAIAGVVSIAAAFSCWDRPFYKHGWWHFLSALGISLLWRSTY